MIKCAPGFTGDLPKELLEAKLFSVRIPANVAASLGSVAFGRDSPPHKGLSPEIMIALNELKHYIKILKCSKSHKSSRIISDKMIEELKNKSLEYEKQLISTEQKCRELEHRIGDLNHMKPPNSATSQKRDVIYKDCGFNNISKTDLDNLKLTLAHNIAKKKILELEEKLKDDSNRDDTISNDIYLNKTIKSKKIKRKTTRKRNEIVDMMNNGNGYNDDVEYVSHSVVRDKPHDPNVKIKNSSNEYKLDFTEIPFIAGKALDEEFSSTVLVSQLTSEIMHLKLKRNKLVQLIWVASSSEASKKDAELQITHIEKEIDDKYNQILQIQTQTNDFNIKLKFLCLLLKEKTVFVKRENLFVARLNVHFNLDIYHASSFDRKFNANRRLSFTRWILVEPVLDAVQGSHKIPTKSATIRREPGSFKLEITDTIPVASNKADKFLHPNVARPKNTDLLKNLKCIQNSLRNNKYL
ncbi:hypothetical protein HELRODRAFT_167967 [Helobdella robusta]|uniref:Uncharacterized protein n=1 Tax=Helobdella robusta TaxID=6412 RepID=T1F006_HELRO|nr:hypothetical protein HELRODRAFT_167967 [Helobdella robusta]ESO10107.1 hypothetical protein HELRODRAFT_167967 [Helobdella robusta]